MTKPVRVVHYAVTARRDVAVPRLSIAVLSDFHAARPFMDEARIEACVAQANALKADLILLLGDYAGHVIGGRDLPPETVAKALSQLSAPLGVFAVFGNHDWRDDPQAQVGDPHPTRWHKAFRDAGLYSLCNAAVELCAGGVAFNLAGLDSQRAFRRRLPYSISGAEDLDATWAQIDPRKFTLLMAHEPDVFPELPAECDLTLSGHTHGGQIAPFGRALVVPSRHGTRYAYGHFVEEARQLIVSGGLGVSSVPFRLGRPPEIVLVTLS